jgi:hypothetical protein
MGDLKKIRRILLSLRVTEEFLRQYPQLALKVETALDRTDRTAASPRSRVERRR